MIYPKQTDNYNIDVLNNNFKEVVQLINAMYNSANGYTDAKIAQLINGAPSALDTLKEIADALETNADVVQALNDAIGTKASISDLKTVAFTGSYNDLSDKPIFDNTADLDVLKREVMASYGYFGIEWNIDELMMLVRAESWDKFAIGDYFIETTTTGEQIQWEIAGKNSYLHCGDTELNKPHIVVCPRDCLQTYYKYNTSNVNAGGYAASLMPANLETEANKFTSKLQGYMTQIRRLENNKGTWAWASRRIFLPGNPELVGFHGWADQYDGGAFNQLPLFVGGNAHLLKGAGFNKSKAARMWYWTADPSAANTTSFCFFSTHGYSATSGASADGGVAPLIVLS